MSKEKKEWLGIRRKKVSKPPQPKHNLYLARIEADLIKKGQELDNINTAKIQLPITTPDGSGYSHEDILNAILNKDIKEIEIFHQRRGTGLGSYKDVILPKNLLIDGDYGDQYINIDNLYMKIEGEAQKVVIKFEELSSMGTGRIEAIDFDDEVFQSCLKEHQKALQNS